MIELNEVVRVGKLAGHRRDIHSEEESSDRRKDPRDIVVRGEAGDERAFRWRSHLEVKSESLEGETAVFRLWE